MAVVIIEMPDEVLAATIANHFCTGTPYVFTIDGVCHLATAVTEQIGGQWRIEARRDDQQ